MGLLNKEQVEQVLIGIYVIESYEPWVATFLSSSTTKAI